MSGCIFPVHRERIVRSVFTCWEGCWVFSLCAIWPPSACNKWLLPADAVINIIHFGPFFCNMEAISSNSCMTWQPQCIVSDRTFQFQNMLSRLKYVFFTVLMHCLRQDISVPRHSFKAEIRILIVPMHCLRQDISVPKHAFKVEIHILTVPMHCLRQDISVPRLKYVFSDDFRAMYIECSK